MATDEAGSRCIGLSTAIALEDELGELGPNWYFSCKHQIDVMASTALLIVSAPIILLAMVAVKLTSKGPAIYSQTRLGRNGRPFVIYKIRTMTHDCERATGACWATTRDPRVTAVGRFLRASHLDELPQLWNVLRGEMSLVGPRPERPEFVTQLERAIPHYRERMSIRPGLTGLAQVNLPPDVDLDGVRRKLVCDLLYIRRCGLWLDLLIILTTAINVLGIPGCVSRKFLRTPGPESYDWDCRCAAFRMEMAPEIQHA